MNSDSELFVNGKLVATVKEIKEIKLGSTDDYVLGVKRLEPLIINGTWDGRAGGAAVIDKMISLSSVGRCGACGSILDYEYHIWWKCRSCGRRYWNSTSTSR